MVDETTQTETTAETPAVTETPAPGPEKEIPGNVPLEEKNISEILNYDPFDEPEEKPAVVVKPPPAVTPAAETPPAPEPLKELTETFKQLLDRQPAPAPAPAPKEEPKPKAPRFNSSLPSELKAAILGPEPTEHGSAALDIFANGIANAVFNAAVEHVQKEVLPSIQRMIQQSTTESRSAENMANTFYGKHPELNREDLKPLVHLIAVDEAQKMGRAFTGWNADLEKKVVDRCKASFNLQPATTTKPPATRKPQFNAGTVTRAADPNAATSVQKDIMETLFG